MQSRDDLKIILNRIDGKGYKAYGDIKGSYAFSPYSLTVDHVQGDPYAVPSRVSVRTPLKDTGYSPNLYSSQIREIAFRDFLGRRFHQAIQKLSKGNRGIGKSGLIEIDHGSQQILNRSSVILHGEFLEIRFFVGLPARGRTILAGQAMEIFFKEIPAIFKEILSTDSVSLNNLQSHVETAEDTQALREQLKEKGLTAFVGNGSLLPRSSGVEQRPLKAGIPLSLRRNGKWSFNVPMAGRSRGWGSPRG